MRSEIYEGGGAMTTTDWITAISTVVLVVVTAQYVRLTKSIAKEAGESAKASARAADAAERGLVVASMPIVITSLGPELGSEGVPVRYTNYGQQPALNVKACAVDGDGEQVAAGGSDVLTAGEEWVLEQTNPDLIDISQSESYTVWTEYYDPFGQAYRTENVTHLQNPEGPGTLRTYRLGRTDKQWHQLGV